jgi:hypothetical protein
VARTLARSSSLRLDQSHEALARCARSLPLGVRSDATRPKEWAAGGSDQSSESEGAGTLGVTPSLARPALGPP